MRRVAAWLVAAALAAGGMAGAKATEPLRPEESPRERDTVARVMDAVRLGECAHAVKVLNSGLQARYPGVFLLAGSLYENGICLKPSWERAERLYLQAAEAGHEGGRLRLVAGLTEQRDLAAALWWLHRSRAQILGQCRVEGFVADDPDAFVLTLQRWEPARVQLCAYVGAVLAQLSSDIDYPTTALSFGEGGTVRATFRPADGQIEVQTLSRETLSGQYGVTSGEDERTAASRKVGSALERHVREAAGRALARFRKPEGLPPDLSIATDFTFVMKLE